MTTNQQLLTTFYQSFQRKDYKAMQNCYADNAVFNDEVFISLNASEVKAMWEMFCIKGKDLRIDFSNLHADEKNGNAEWTAAYTFSKTNRKVINHIKANFSFENGKILRHTDHFNFYNWSCQALGLTGVLLGWTSFVKNKVRKEGMKNLSDFMNKKNKFDSKNLRTL
ncbi:MAG: nuclear transport factor 2 family protein [Ginsengibacter sp.]